MEPAQPRHSTDDNDVFELARKRFLDSLDEGECLRFSPCTSSQDFLSAVGKLETSTQQAARRGKALRCVQSLTKRLQPYFEVVNIFVSSNPQFAALFWGAFRLVLEVSSKHPKQAKRLCLTSLDFTLVIEQSCFILRQTREPSYPTP